MLFYIALSFVLLIFSIILCNKRKSNLILFSLFWFIFFIITDIYIVSNYFTWRWIDQSVIYQIFSWFKWAWIKSDYLIILFWIVLIILWILFSYFIYFYIKKNISKIIEKKAINKLSFIFLLISIIIHPIFNNILELNWYYIEDYLQENKIDNNKNINFYDYYKIPTFQKANEDNKNLIFIYLESFESLYLDKTVFPWLTNWLNKLKEESTYFNNIKQWYWASWTIAWMVWSQCWLPLITNWWWEGSAKQPDAFLPSAVCMWDFLKYAWYNLNYIWGASLEFAWKWNFYKAHWFNSIEWKEELEKNLNNKDYNYDWWLYDDDLFDLAYKKYEKLSESDEKFGLFMINMDTHWDKWVKSKKCDNIEYTKEDSILNSYHCTDYLVSDFINKIKNNKNFKNTTIVIASDHLAMNNNNSVDILNENKDKRNILFFILNSDNKEKIEINKKWSTQDIWATVLSKIWFDVKQLGIWFNLLSGSWFTVTDQNPNIIFWKWDDYYESFWNDIKLK